MEKERELKNKKINREGRIKCTFLKEQGWAIINGYITGNEKEELTYAGGQGESVIDYATGDNKTREKVRSMVVGKRVKSDHHSIIVNIEEKEERQRGRKQREKRTEGKRN